MAANNPFAVVDDFLALRQGIGTSPLARQGSSLRTQLRPIRPDYSAVPPQQHQPVTYASAAAPVRTEGGVGGYFSALEGQFGGLTQTSGYRDPEHNRRVGGAPNSYHTHKDEHGHERARDYVGTAEEMQAAKLWAEQNGAKEALLHDAGSGYHLHVAWATRGALQPAEPYLRTRPHVWTAPWAMTF